MRWDSVINMMPYGDRFRKHRKWLQDALLPKSVLHSYRPMQRREAYTLLAGLCESPGRVNDHIKRCESLPLRAARYSTRGSLPRICCCCL